jgi:hypothetical protein
MKDLGPLTWILGMEIVRDRDQRRMRVTQRTYIDKMLKRFGMDECKPVGTPAEGCLRRDASGKPDKEYMAVVGSLLIRGHDYETRYRVCCAGAEQTPARS